MPELNDTQLQKAISALERESQHLNADDPRQAAQLMRKLLNSTGVDLCSGMENALRRLEEGENPEKIEEDFGEILNSEEIFKAFSKASKKARKRPPQRNETLYRL